MGRIQKPSNQDRIWFYGRIEMDRLLCQNSQTVSVCSLLCSRFRGCYNFKRHIIFYDLANLARTNPTVLQQKAEYVNKLNYPITFTYVFNLYADIHQQFEVTLPREERVAWMWILIFTFFVSELATFLRSLRICLFKTWRLPSKWEFFSLFITESLPTIGSALLVFCILPELDVVKGAMLTNAVCFIPAFIGKSNILVPNVD